jgi:hypothetical protein
MYRAKLPSIIHLRYCLYDRNRSGCGYPRNGIWSDSFYFVHYFH